MLIVLAYVGVHFAIYALLLRGRASLRKEKGIFVYHLSSAILVGLAATILAFLEPSAFGLSGVALVLSVHGIYSISFLELWSLAQGGYSLSVLASIVKAESVSAAPDFSALELIGQLKQDDRIVALERFGFLRRSADEIALTTSGRKVAGLLQGLLAWIDPHAKP